MPVRPDTSPCPEMRGRGFRSRRLQGNQRESRVGVRKADRWKEGSEELREGSVCARGHTGRPRQAVCRVQGSFKKSQSHKLALRGTLAET